MEAMHEPVVIAVCLYALAAFFIIADDRVTQSLKQKRED